MTEAPKMPYADPASKLILVADDDESIIEFLITVLQKDGFRTKAAMDGLIALKRAKEEKVDLIMMDMMMPNSGGFETIQKFQADDATRNIPIIIITAKRVDRTTWDLIKQEPNVKEIVMKPVRPFQLLQTVHSILHTLPPTNTKKSSEDQKQQRSSPSPETWELPPAFRKDRKES